MSNTGVSVSGTILNALHMGFTVRDSVGESIDNSIDAGAKEIHIVFDRVTRSYTHVDDGCGMNPENMPEHFAMNHRSNGHTHGRFGVGANIPGIVLTRLKGCMNIISKTSEASDYCTMHLDMQAAADTGIFNRVVNTVDNDGTDNRSQNGVIVWKQWEHVTNDRNGTILQIRCSDDVSTELHESIESGALCESLGQHYFRQIRNGLHIYLNCSQIVKIDPLNRDIAAHVNTQTYTVRRIDDVNRLCLSKRNNKPKDIKMRGAESEYYIHIALDRNCKKKITYKPVPVDENNRPINDVISEMTIISAYDPTWTGSANIIKGGHYFVREEKLVRHFDSEKVLTGDHGRRPIIDNARHEISFNRYADELFGVLVNKSDLRKEKIGLFESIHYVTTEYTNMLYKEHYKVVSDNNVASSIDHAVNQEEDDNNSVASSIDDDNSNISVDNVIFNQVMEDEPMLVEQQLDALCANDVVSDNESIENLVIIARPSPKIVVLGLRFTLDSRQQMLSIENIDTNYVIKRINTYGEGAGLRKWLCALLRMNGRETFIEQFIEQLPPIAQLATTQENV